MVYNVYIGTQQIEAKIIFGKLQFEYLIFLNHA